MKLADYVRSHGPTWGNRSRPMPMAWRQILELLEAGSCSSPGDIARALDMSLVQVQSMMYRMRKAGLVERAWRARVENLRAVEK